MLATKGMRFPIGRDFGMHPLVSAYPLSYRHLEEMMQERGVFIDHSSINRWAIRFLPLLEKAFRRHKRPVSMSWRTDETYIKVKGVWKYLYRAVDKSGANKAAMDEINTGRQNPIVVQQVKYFNNILEQDHQAIKRITRPMLNFKSFRSAKSVLAGIELMHMIRKGQFMIAGANARSFADQFYALAGKIRPV